MSLSAFLTSPGPHGSFWCDPAGGRWHAGSHLMIASFPGRRIICNDTSGKHSRSASASAPEQIVLHACSPGAHLRACNLQLHNKLRMQQQLHELHTCAGLQVCVRRTAHSTHLLCRCTTTAKRFLCTGKRQAASSHEGGKCSLACQHKWTAVSV